MTSRGRLLIGAGVAVAAVAAVLLTRPGRPSPATPGGPVRYAAVERTDIALALTLDGALGYGPEQPLKGAAGRITWLPPAGTSVSRGEPLFRADDRPVTLWYGTTPLFRALDRPGLVGRDVKVAADNLQALGYPVGAQPAAGTTVTQPPEPNPSGSATAATAVKVRPGDAVFTAAMAGALRRWQAKVGLPATGAIGPADVLVLPQQVRVSAVTAQLGDDATTPVLAVTGTAKVVTVQVELTEADAVRSAEQVTVVLPDGSTVPGRVGGIGRSAATNPDPAGPARLTATITLSDPSRAQALDSAPVRVRFAAQTHTGVLVVPVGALLALSEGGYAVQTEQGRLIPVTTGLFEQGRVEVSGDGLAPGLRVVTAS